MPFQALSFRDLERNRFDFDARVQATPDIDHFCSSSPWILAARESFHGFGTPAVFRMDGGYLAMFRESIAGMGRVWLPMEAAWCLSCPLVGEAVDLSRQLPELLRRHSSEWDSAILTGLSMNSVLWSSLLQYLGPAYRLYSGPEVKRCIASLKGGVDGFLSRRSPKFRSNLRRAIRLSENQHLHWRSYAPQNLTQSMDLFSIMMDIEARSWKGLSGSGVNTGGMRTFYKRMIQLLTPNVGFRMIVAEQDGQPMGYILGGVLGSLYRGFQFSFDQNLASISLGNLLQMKMIEHLSNEGFSHYDLGTDIEYKKKWAECTMVTHALIIKK